MILKLFFLNLYLQCYSNLNLAEYDKFRQYVILILNRPKNNYHIKYKN